MNVKMVGDGIELIYFNMLWQLNFTEETWSIYETVIHGLQDFSRALLQISTFVVHDFV